MSGLLFPFLPESSVVLAPRSAPVPNGTNAPAHKATEEVAKAVGVAPPHRGAREDEACGGNRGGRPVVLHHGV